MFNTGRLIFDDEFISVLHSCIPEGASLIAPLILKSIDSELAAVTTLSSPLKIVKEDLDDLMNQAVALQMKHELYSKLSLAYGVQESTELYNTYKKSLKEVADLVAPRINSCERSGDSLSAFKTYLDHHVKIRGQDIVLYNSGFEIVFKNKELYEIPKVQVSEENLQSFCSQFENEPGDIYFLGQRTPLLIGQADFNLTYDCSVGCASLTWDSVGAAKAGNVGIKKYYSLMTYLTYLRNQHASFVETRVMKCVL